MPNGYKEGRLLRLELDFLKHMQKYTFRELEQSGQCCFFTLNSLAPSLFVFPRWVKIDILRGRQKTLRKFEKEDWRSCMVHFCLF